MSKKQISGYVIGAIAFIILAFFFVRFVIGGPEDDWLCVNNQWIKHGNPFAPMPTIPCGEKPQAGKSVKLYYYNPNLDKDESGNIACSRNGLVPVERKIPITITPIQDTINLLLQGQLTSAERATGLTTEYPLAGLALTGASFKDGVLTFSFIDPSNRTGGGSCRVGILWMQIEETAKQFDGVKQVRFLPEELFQP